jgi:hypothetical protein
MGDVETCLAIGEVVQKPGCPLPSPQPRLRTTKRTMEERKAGIAIMLIEKVSSPPADFFDLEGIVDLDDEWDYLSPLEIQDLNDAGLG